MLWACGLVCLRNKAHCAHLGPLLLLPGLEMGLPGVLGRYLEAFVAGVPVKQQLRIHQLRIHQGNELTWP